VRRLNILEEGIAIDYALKGSSNTGDDFGSVSYGAGPVNSPRRQQHDFGSDSGSADDYTGDAPGLYRQQLNSGGADARADDSASGYSCGSSGGGPDMVGRPD
jgi:hypothetical protein